MIAIGEKLQPIGMMTSDGVQTLLANLADGDLDLRFQNGRSVRVHGAKLKLASSCGGVLCNLMEDILEKQIERFRLTDERTSAPFLKVTSCSP